MRKLLILVLSITGFYANAQVNIPIGTWRAHLAYNDGLRVAEVKNRIYCATSSGLYYFDKSDNTIKGLSKVEGFSATNTSTIGYSAKYDMLFIGYSDGNIDILKGNTIYHISSFVKSGLSGLKQINRFYFSDKYCYIATSLGIIEYDLKRQVFGETYQLFSKDNSVLAVYGITILGQNIFAATTRGILRADLGASNLKDTSQWKSISPDSCSQLISFDNKVLASFANGVLKNYDGNTWSVYRGFGEFVSSMDLCYGKAVIATATKVVVIDAALKQDSILSNAQNHAILDNTGAIWMAKNTYGMIVNDKGAFYFIKPNGPATNFSNNITAYKNEIWVCPGLLLDNGATAFNHDGFFQYREGTWTNYSNYNVTNWADQRDAYVISVDTTNGHKFIAYLDSGIAEFDGDRQIVNYYNSKNSSLRYGSTCSGMAFDYANNLWVSNYRAFKPLCAKSPDGQWYSFNVGGENEFFSILTDDYGYVWALARLKSKIIVYNTNHTLADPNDDSHIELLNQGGKGNLPGTNPTCMAKDKSGQIWIGSNDGVSVFPDPGILFANVKNYDAQRIYTKAAGGGYLLSGQVVTAIAVDGGNRKWFGTTSGVWLTNPGGDQILAHYTTDNSPLNSNYIRGININKETGEVFLATDAGVVSYRSTATEGGDQGGEVYAFPNPVKPGYQGPIAIRGLMRDAIVKITDVTGKLVYQTKAQGGQAVWYGKNFSGEEAHSGVYYVFSTNSDGSETNITKILIVR